jgi:hypothetical protein
MRMGISEIYKLMDGLPPGAWVAISTEQRRVLSYGDDADTVMEEALLKVMPTHSLNLSPTLT